MQKTVRVIVVPYLISPAEHRITYEMPWKLGLTVGDAIARAKAHLDGLGISELHVSRNGFDAVTTQELMPDDIIIVTAYHGVQGLVWVALWKLGMYAAINVTSAIIANALVIGAGLLINSIMAPSVPGGIKGEQSTYGFGGMRNLTTPGNPVPVAYGTVWSAPPIIGAYRIVDTDYNMWQYLLLAVGAGKTNNAITASRVKVGEELLTSFENYVFNCTDGDTTIDATTETDLALFAKVHHDYSYDRKLRHDTASDDTVAGLTLLNFNPAKWAALTAYTTVNFIIPTTPGSYCYECTTAGTSGAAEPAWGVVVGGVTDDGTAKWTCRALTSLPVVDSSVRGNPWTLQGAAKINVNTPMWGNGYLDLNADGDYITTDDYIPFLTSRPLTAEFWVRFPDLNDRIFFSSQSTVADGETTTVERTILGYIGGSLRFQCASTTYITSDPPADVDALTWVINADIAAAVTPTLNVWRYVRVFAAPGSFVYEGALTAGSTGAKVYLQMENDSDELEVLTSSSDFVTSDNDDWLNGTTPAYAALTNKTWYTQQIGHGKYVTTAGVVTELYGNCDIDCFRMSRGAAYDLPASDTEIGEVPSAEIATDSTGSVSTDFIIQTQSKCDGVRIILEFQEGLGRVKKNGHIVNRTVTLGYDYRVTGTVPWTTSTITCTARRITSVPRFQFELTFPSRNLYDVRIYRNSIDTDDSTTAKDASTLVSFEEIINIQQCYPGMQVMVLGIKASDKASGQIGTIRVKHQRTSIEVPDWDGGTEFVDPSIPANQMRDACTNEFYGIRQTCAELKETAFEDWETWTTGLVDGVARATCNIVYDEVSNFSDGFLSHIEQAGRVRMLREGSMWKPVTDEPRTPQYVFSAGNILTSSYGSKESSLQWSGYDETEKVDAVSVTYWDSAKGGVRRTTALAKASWYETLARLPKVQNVEIRGCSNQDEANRHARFRINKNEFITMRGQHKAGMQCAGIEFGEVFTLVPSSYAAVWGGNLRCDHVAASTIKLNATVNFAAVGYSGLLYLFAVGPTGAYSSYEVLGPWGTDTSELTISGVHTGNRGDAIGLGRPTLDQITQQVLRVSHDFAAREVSFEWCEYSNSVFYHAGWGGGIVAI